MPLTVPGIHLGIDTHANRPAGNAVPDASFYSCSDHGLIYKSNYAGNSWATWATLGAAASGSITASGYTQNTARLLGRTTASAGAIEEITVGSGLSLAAGALTATGGGVASGTSFPGSPASGDLFWRTDLPLLCYYDGTRWLTVSEYTLMFTTRTPLADGITATATLGNAPTGLAGFDMWLESWRVITYVDTTNDGSNYWTLTLDKLTPANAVTNVVTFNTSADTANVWTGHANTIDAVVAGGTHAAFRVVATKTASGGALVTGIGEVTYRRVVT